MFGSLQYHLHVRARCDIHATGLRIKWNSIIFAIFFFFANSVKFGMNHFFNVKRKSQSVVSCERSLEKLNKSSAHKLFTAVVGTKCPKHLMSFKATMKQ